jgi:hypothetical protein
MSVSSHYLMSRSYELTYLIHKRYTNKYIRNYIKNVNTTITESEEIEIGSHVTKWVYSLIKTSQHINDSKYLYQACQIMITNYHKIHDELDVFITLNTLILNLKRTSKINKLSATTNNVYIKILLEHLETASKKVHEYFLNTKRLYTTDPLGIGFLLTACLKIRRLIHYAKSHKFITKHISFENLYKLYEILLDNSLKSLRACNFTPHRINNDGYRWFGICIGLEGINILYYNYINDYIDRDKYFNKIKILMGYYRLKRLILDNFNTYSFNKGNWNSHKDINIVMFFNIEFPILDI